MQLAENLKAKLEVVGNNTKTQTMFLTDLIYADSTWKLIERAPMVSVSVESV
jgi:hypothetical protein